LRGKLLGYAQAGLQVPPVGTQTQTAPPSIGSVLALGSLTLDG
jgi:hypothetical protein